MKVLMIHDETVAGMSIHLSACKSIHSVAIAPGFNSFQQSLMKEKFNIVIVQHVFAIKFSQTVTRLIKKYNPEAKIWVVGYSYMDDDTVKGLTTTGVDEVIYYYDVYDRLKKLAL